MTWSQTGAEELQALYDHWSRKDGTFKFQEKPIKTKLLADIINDRVQVDRTFLKATRVEHFVARLNDEFPKKKTAVFGRVKKEIQSYQKRKRSAEQAAATREAKRQKTVS